MKNKNKATRFVAGQRAGQWASNPNTTMSMASDDPEIRQALREQLMQLSLPQLSARLTRQVRENRAAAIRANTQRDIPQPMIQRILDTGGTSTGNILPRVDLEQTIYAIFVKQFPWWDRIRKDQANGLKHTWNVASATGAATDSQLTASSDLANAQTDVGSYAQYQTVNIAILDTLRGVSLKELYAVQQSGMTYSPETQEILMGTIRLKSLAQRLIYQGNESVSGKTNTQEWGVYNANSFDGLRMIAAGLSTYSASATQVDQDLTTGGGPFTITQSVNYAAAQQMNQGANPSILTGSPIVLNKLMNEQEGKQRTMDQMLVPGVQVPGIVTVAGVLPYIWAPGGTPASGTSALGNYARQSDSTTVEDLYVLDESMLCLRYLGAADIQVIEIPVGVDTQLSRRFILFIMCGLQVIDNGAFQGKVRIPV